MDDENLSPHIKYWLNASSKHDCFFLVGHESGPTERIGAFKVFLEGHSEPFRSMLGDSDISEEGDIRIIDIEPDVFKLFLKCIYAFEKCDTLIKKFSFQESVNLLYVVDKYLVNSIKPKLITHVLQMLPFSCNPDSNTLNNVFIAISNQVCFQDEKLEKALLKLIKHNIEQMFSYDQFLQLSSEVLLYIIQLDPLKTTETKIWDAVVKWAKHNSKSDDGKVLRELISEHLEHIRFRVMGLEEFCNKVVKTGILTPDEVYEVCNVFGDKKLLNNNYICNITEPRQQPEDLKNMSSEPKDLKNVSSHVIQNISELQGAFNCTAFQCKGITWNLLLTLRQEKDNHYFGVYLHCKENFKNNWRYPVKFQLYLINQGKNNNFSKGELSHTYRKIEDDWGYMEFYPWNKLLDRENGFIKDNSIIVMVHIKSVASNVI